MFKIDHSIAHFAPKGKRPLDRERGAPPVMVGSPFEDVSGPEDFERLGFSIDAPEGAGEEAIASAVKALLGSGGQGEKSIKRWGAEALSTFLRYSVAASSHMLGAT